MLAEKIAKLPPHLQQEALDFVEFLSRKYRPTNKKKKKFVFAWEGGLAHLKKEYSSVELQHKASE